MFGYDAPHFGFLTLSYPVQVLPCMDHGHTFGAFAINAWARGPLDAGSQTFGSNCPPSTRESASGASMAPSWGPWPAFMPSPA